MPLTSTQTRALLAQLGVVPRKNLGQNFLTEGNLVRKSLALAEIKADDVVVEIGAGLGTLTEALLAAGAEVFAIEVDRQLDRNLRATLLPRFPEKFHLLEGDAVAHPRAGLPENHPAAATGTYKIVANLPYAVSTPWLDVLLAGPLPERMVLMLQREAAARFTAAPGTGDRGAISIFTEAAFVRADRHSVSRKCFYPEPKVDSVLLGLRRRPDARAFRPATKKLIREFFTHRRKQIGALVRQIAKAIEATEGAGSQPPSIRHSQPETRNSKLETRLAIWLESLHAHGLDARARPEELPLAAWLALEQALATQG
jgi:16S rRNA (adenine1518-N6/adenine1519-N6)-dimethyltransferase